jgi:hypothetical protein
LVLAAISYLVVLLGLGAAYFWWPTIQSGVPSAFGPIPLGVPWWGALCAVTGSLYGIFFYNKKWDSSYDIWHYTRPLVGATMGSFAFLAYLFRVGASGSKASTSGGIAYYLVAFVVGNSDSLFHQLVQRVSGVLFSSKDAAGSSSSG